jgi:4-amino-4-deoxy-L-arabinose transferase-like glycosyltransferase
MTATGVKGLNLQHPAVLILFLFFGFVVNLGGVPLFDLDEGAFSEATREILASGVWSATYLDGIPRYDKPILTYWLQAGSVTLFGLNEFALRLHSALCALLWGAAIYFFSAEFINRKSAKFAVLIFSSTLLITIIGRAATADALLNLFIAMSLFDIYRYSKSRSCNHLLRSWLWISLGMLTKGPVAAGIPLLVSLLWFASERRLADWRRAILDLRGWLILLAILLPWLIAIWQEQGAGFFKGFLLDHNLGRFTATREGHGGQIYYYLIALPLALLPFSGMLPGLLLRLKALYQRPFERLLLIWFLVVFVLVSLSQTQLPHYVLYGVTPLLILFAKYRRVLARRRWQLLLPAGFFALQIGLCLYAMQTPQTPGNLYVAGLMDLLPESFGGVYLLCGIAGLLLVGILAVNRFPVWEKLVVCGLAQTVFCYLLLLPAVGNLQQMPVKQAALSTRHIDTEFVAYRINMPSFSVYRQAITQRRPPQLGDYIFTRADKLESLSNAFPDADIDIFYRYGGIVLARLNPPSAPHEFLQSGRNDDDITP